MDSPSPFSYEVRGTQVIISRGGVDVSVLRGEAARRFLGKLNETDAQQLMARATGNYKRGNERAAKQHPRNSG